MKKLERLFYAFVGAVIGFSIFAGCVFVFSLFAPLEDFNYGRVYALAAALTVGYFIRRTFQILGGEA